MIRGLLTVAAVLAGVACSSPPPSEDVAPEVVEGIGHGTTVPQASTLYYKAYGYCTCFGSQFYCDPTPSNPDNGDESFPGRCIFPNCC
jgi:hypothetical protein